ETVGLLWVGLHVTPAKSKVAESLDEYRGQFAYNLLDTNVRQLMAQTAAIDDEGWWALTWINAYDLTKDARYLATARSVFGDMTTGWDTVCGGGIWSRAGEDLKSVRANGPATILLTRLGNRVDLQQARAMAEWMEDNLLDETVGLLWVGLHVNMDGEVREMVKEAYTYTQGVYLGACLELAAAGDPVWAERAERTVLAISEHLTNNGVLRGHGGGDGGLY
ncbi:glycoside hydrolase family 76 protein, partial [Kibdelosporangium lantanae]